MLDAGDDRFCEAVDGVVVCLPAGDVLTDSGDVRPEVFVIVTLLLLLDCVVFEDKGGVLRVGAPEVLKSCGEATPVDDVESAYLQLAADGFNMLVAGLAAPPGLGWCILAILCGCNCV